MGIGLGVTSCHRNKRYESGNDYIGIERNGDRENGESRFRACVIYIAVFQLQLQFLSLLWSSFFFRDREV